ncbi:MAG TPA: type II toxin-antitoxin system VapC family toxin [Gemmatimonadaceae bacterium]|nr:type II toxin-antitoxin system VapC family toxin [Gemmatimonadaceae bacterium]
MIRSPHSNPGETLLLDTHIWVWMVSNTMERVSAVARAALEESAAKRSLRVSAISVWEVGVLSRKKRLGLTMHVAAWVERGLATPGVQQVSLDSTVALLSTTLPEEPPSDPADRFLLAKAYSYGWTLVTSDARIIQYAGKQGIAVLDARD